MSSLSDQVVKKVTDIFDAAWDERDGRVVPETDDIALTNGAVQLDATYLYADMKDSSLLAKKFKPHLAARVVRLFLVGATELIKARGGEIRSFDGDRVMGIFIGDSKNTSAMRACLNINWVVDQVIRPMLEKDRPVLQQNGWSMGHCVGVATGKAMLVRGGVRGDNDIVSIGEAPNLAAKLSGIRGEYSPSIVTADVYGHANESVKVKKITGQQMWDGPKRRVVGPYTVNTYRSGWYQVP